MGKSFNESWLTAFNLNLKNIKDYLKIKDLYNWSCKVYLENCFKKMIVIISTSVTLRQLSKYMCTNKCDKNKLTLRIG